ncbi:hypothetical protein BpHYR1_043761 [Brachionus plicatilis]|uniref:Uncharacterized protein n=1 Tax=Brachionus plicatilis TaxID=10195 RepID=A0A3M7PZG6_BRAPC|nr:hypothetical protein BpHYR1_043761 [Brachionus plicatilis]
MLYPFPNYFRSIVLSINVWPLDQILFYFFSISVVV